MSKKLQPNVTLNHAISIGGTTDGFRMSGDMTAYSLIASKDKKRYYLLLSKCKKNVTNLIIFLIIPAIMFPFIFFIPIHFILRILIWGIVCSVMCGGIFYYMKNANIDFQKFPLMVLDSVNRYVTFYRRKNLSFLQIEKSPLRIHFDQLLKVQIVATRKLENGERGGYLTLMTVSYSALILITRNGDNEKRNLIFVNVGDPPLIYRTAKILAATANVPYEHIPSPPLAEM